MTTSRVIEERWRVAAVPLQLALENWLDLMPKERISF